MASERGRDVQYRIAETAMALFLEHGYETVTVEAVADASEVSRRTVFRHFGGKVELPFPDHSARLELLRTHLEAAPRDADPVETVIAATTTSLRDFLTRPQLVFRRYRLTRLVAALRDREIVEHERYVAVTSAFLRDRLPEGAAPYESAGLAAIIDAMHRAALGAWARSDGATDALGDLEAGLDWVRTMRATPTGGSTPTGALLAVVPDTAAARRALQALRDESTPLG